VRFAVYRPGDTGLRADLGAILKKHDRYWAGIAVYGDYMPWSAHKEMGGDGSNYPAHSGRILDLKDGKDGAVIPGVHLLIELEFSHEGQGDRRAVCRSPCPAGVSLHCIANGPIEC
jgi:hypothetical protein